MNRRYNARRVQLTLGWLAVALASYNCNAVFGLDEPLLASSSGGGASVGQSSGGGGGASVAQSSSSVSSGNGGSGGLGGGGSGGVGGIAGSGGVGGMGGSGGAQTVTRTFGERTAANVTGVTADTMILSVPASANYGDLDLFIMNALGDPEYHSVGLLRFDVSDIPGAATVISAEVELWVGSCNACAGSSASVVSLYPLNETWDEGNGSFPGYANYNDRTPNAAWSTPGAMPPSRSNVSLGAFSGSTANTQHVIPLPVTLVADWVANPNLNFGVALENNSFDSVGLVSRNSTATEKRPLLTVTYETTP